MQSRFAQVTKKIAEKTVNKLKNDVRIRQALSTTGFLIGAMKGAGFVYDNSMSINGSERLQAVLLGGGVAVGSGVATAAVISKAATVFPVSTVAVTSAFFAYNVFNHKNIQEARKQERASDRAAQLEFPPQRVLQRS